MKKTYWIAALIFVLYIALIVGIGYALSFSGTRFILFCVLLGVVGAIAVVVAVLYIRKSAAPAAAVEGSVIEASNLTALVRSADARLKASPGGAKSIASMPLLYVLGDENSAKTQTVLQSGLDAELLAGAVQRDGMVAPTQLANIWYSASAVIVEAGGALLRQSALCQQLVRLTQPNKLGTALKKGGLQPTRAAILCVSIERVLATNSADSVRALGQMLNERLRMVSQTLGISLPVYVLFTKLDTIPSFADFATNFTEDEARQSLGSLLARLDAGAGLYAEQAGAQTSARFDELCYSLSEFRLEVLSRGGEPANLAKAYEFPRELRKLRSAITDLLVEVGRPSQLGVNPFLRGFYFSGMRARLIDDGMSAPAQPAAPAPAPDAGATRIFSFNAAQLPSAPAPPVGRGARRVPQWVFLPHLFTRVFLADRSALDTSRASTKVNVVKRMLIGAVACCLLFYVIALTVSYFNNAALEARLRDAAAQPMQSVSRGEPASLTDLQHLEALRLVFVQVASYRKDGAPLSYRWGLYDPERMYTAACSAYGTHFRTLLLAPTQANILTQLAALPATPVPAAEYTATYRPLRTYLITTSNPEKSTVDLVPDALQQAWIGNHTLPSESTDLSLAQFTTYAETLPQPGSCMAALGGSPHTAEVGQARAYLSHFQGFNQVYASMKAAADRKFPGIRFNDKFPGSVRYVVDDYTVEGAFSKDGYAFMQNAFQHPEPYTSGEEWVLGAQSGPPPDLNALKAQLPTQYLNDFLNVWRTYLKTARVVPGGTFPETKEKLHQLDSPSSALLELFSVISTNTAVPNAAFSQPFQAPQSVVAPNATVLPTAGPYIQGLAGLDNAIGAMMMVPNYQGDPASAQPVMTAAATAEGAVSNLRGGFTPPDPAGNMDTTSEKLLLAPIKSVEALAQGAPAKAAGGGAKDFCAGMKDLLSKFPFNPDSQTDATPDEVAKVFLPGQGSLAQFAATMSKIIVLQGNTYVPAPGSPVSVNPGFLHFLNNAQTFSSTFYPAGGGAPHVLFTLTQESTPNLQPATLDVDGTTSASAGQAKQFTWTSSTSSSIQLKAPAGQANSAVGPWALFHLARMAKHPATNKLEFVFQMNNQTVMSSTGIPLDYKYDVSGPGAALLNYPGSVYGQLHCVAKVSQ